MPAPRSSVIRTVTTYTYTIRFRDGSETTESFDHRLDLSEVMQLMAHHPDAFYNPTPQTETATYQMPLADFVRLAQRISPEPPPPEQQVISLPTDQTQDEQK